MKKRTLLLLLVLSLLFSIINVYAENISSNGFGIQHKITTNHGSFYITVQEVKILTDESWEDDAARKSEDTQIIAIHAIVENIDYALDEEYFNELGSYEVFSSMEVIDQDGFSLEFYNVSGSTDGKYEVCPDINPGMKKRASYPYYAEKTTSYITIKFKDGEKMAVPLRGDLPASVPEENTEPTSTGEFDPSAYTVDELVDIYNHIEAYLKEVAPDRIGTPSDNNPPAETTVPESNNNITAANDYQTLCFNEVASYLKNPASAKLLQCYEATADDSDYSLFLMDISAENSFGGTVTNSFFIIYDRSTNKLSAIEFDGTVSHFKDIKDSNTFYAKYLTLNDGVGSFVSNQIQMSITSFASYLKAFYYVYYK